MRPCVHDDYSQRRLPFLTRGAVPLFVVVISAMTMTMTSLLIAPVHAQTRQNYVDDETGQVESFDPKEKIPIKIVNKSRFRVDIHWDDGNLGKNIATAEIAGEANIDTFAGHSFFVTRHGVREKLYDPPDADDPIKLEVSKPRQIFVVESSAAPSIEPCQDRFSVCRHYARPENGGCMSSPGWMIVHCCKSCDEELNASHLIDPKVRCSRENLNMTEAAWKPGSLNKLFKSWATEDKYRQYDPHILSSPGAEHGGQDGPWVITFDKFLTDDETEELIRGGHMSGFERSTDQGAMNALGEQEKIVSRTRTSSNAWCTQECEQLPGVISVTDRIEKVTGVPRANYESFQILDYGPNQFYRSHHDSSTTDDSPAGHRIMTFFLYLTDVEEGGETFFNKLDLAVKPKKGRALVWPSVTDSDPEYWDSRMYHEARDVIKGKKMAANHWIHLYDYVTPNFWGCTGSFS